jgi:hypothetical protein
MKNIFKASKCGIAALLTLCILLGIAGTCMNVAAMEEETTVSTEEPTIATVDTTSELMPMMARGCSDYYYYERGMDMDAVAAERGWSMKGKYIYQNGKEIGRYDDGSNGQEPHFHIYHESGVHYILYS